MGSTSGKAHSHIPHFNISFTQLYFMHAHEQIS